MSDSPSCPRVVITTVGKFHSFDLARELHKRGMLQGIYSGYPRYKLRNESIPEDKIHSYPFIQTCYMALGRFGINNRWLQREISWLSCTTLDAYVARHLPECDAFVGLSSAGLRTGQKAQQQGALYICDRGSTHIRYQDRVLREEYKRLNLVGATVDPRTIAREEEEYKQADLITVPSSVVRNSFIEMGVPPEKVVRVSYGVDLSRFEPVGSPDPERFDVLFVGGISVRKGVYYLLEAFHNLNHPRKQLTFVGTVHPLIRPMIERYLAMGDNIACLGHYPQPKLKEVMSRHHIMVLPSIEEGLALVQAQAMACGCPVLATVNTGAEDLFTDKKEGYIVSSRDSEALRERLQYLSDNFEERQRLSEAALLRVRSVGGWKQYGDRFAELLTGKVKSQEEKKNG